MMVVAIKALHLPAGPVAVSLMGSYGVFLFLETRMVTRFLRDSAAGRSTTTGTGNGTSAPKNEAKPQADGAAADVNNAPRAMHGSEALA